MLNIKRKILSLSIAFGLALLPAACHKRGNTDSGGGNAPAPAPAPGSPAPGASPSPSPTPGPSAQAYVVYDDKGGVLADPQVLLFTGGGLTIAEITTGAPEGTKFLRSSNAVPGAFWGVTVDKNNTGRIQDLSTYAGGALKFQIRVNRALASGERLVINLTDNAQTQSILLSASHGFNASTANAWQAISIPISSYNLINKAKVKVPFAIAVDSPAGTSALEFDIDIVQWSKS